MAACIVSYVDVEGLRHAVEVEAESLYEAAALAVRTFRQHDCEPGELSKIEVEVRSSVTHTVTLKKIHSWLQGRCKKSQGSGHKRPFACTNPSVKSLAKTKPFSYCVRRNVWPLYSQITRQNKV